MKYYLTVVALFLLQCSNNHADKQNVYAQSDTLRNSSPTNSMKKDTEPHAFPTNGDPISEFVKQNTYYSTLINLSFCEKELVKQLNNNDSAKKEWKNKIQHLFTMYDDPINNESTGAEMAFFRDRLIAQTKLQTEYADGYDFLVNSLPIVSDTTISLNKYQKLVLRFDHADGGNFPELSGMYFSFLIVDGMRFINAIEQKPKCVMLFRKWINNIEETEFVANGADNVPPQIIERKRNYLIDKYSTVQDSLMKEAVFKIRSAKISIVD
jgi:hypothetical protein